MLRDQTELRTNMCKQTVARPFMAHWWAFHTDDLILIVPSPLMEAGGPAPGDPSSPAAACLGLGSFTLVQSLGFK